MAELRSEVPDGARLGIDWGKARIGVAAVGRGTTLAYPVATVPAGPRELDQLLALVAEYEPAVIYVGLPLTLTGERSFAAAFVLERAAALAARIDGAAVRLVDERLSTTSASRNLGSSGRSAKRQRSVIDQAAAVEILQRAVEFEVASAMLAGEPLDWEET